MIKKLKPACLLYGCLLMASCLEAQGLQWMEGSWSGEGYQAEAANQTTWSMNLYFSAQSGELTIKADYPSLLCGGIWALQNTEPNRAIFIETLTYGKGKCLDGEKLIVSYIDENYLSIVFYDTGIKEDIVATALLRKN